MITIQSQYKIYLPAFGLSILFGVGFSQEFNPDGYGEDYFHTNQELTNVGKAGMVLGFTSIGIALIYALVRIVIDQLETHKRYDKQLFDARARMLELGLNVEEIDKEYERSLRKQQKAKKGLLKHQFDSEEEEMAQSHGSETVKISDASLGASQNNKVQDEKKGRRGKNSQALTSFN
ncbi:UNKNOWN [Stylonychia lemnae]|uniref:Uncharacterized protein n=1 Tax=Stylonychia lemnae TaxID=5949 RepID=A0A078AN45_STYLE|nr:UNKNOWN [Stylonychia lemnae]|eukprot:CDW83785.1 UNKNOWN [Stylonychia lemnae]